MGNRKPAVRKMLKSAARKHKEGKLDEAMVIADQAGRAASESKGSMAIVKAAKGLKLPVEVIYTARKSDLDRRLPNKISGSRPRGKI